VIVVIALDHRALAGRAWSFDNRILKHNTLRIVLFDLFVCIDVNPEPFSLVPLQLPTSPMLVLPRGSNNRPKVAVERLRQCTSFVDITSSVFLLFAFMKAFQDRRAPGYQRGLVRKPLRKIGVILLHDVERRFLGELAMVLGK